MAQTIESIRNGVDTEQLFGTLDAIKAQPELARFQFRAQQPLDRRRAQPQRRSRAFYGALAEDTTRDARRSSSTPASRRSSAAPTPAPNPAEYCAAALAVCLTTTLVYVAAARGVR